MQANPINRRSFGAIFSMSIGEGQIRRLHAWIPWLMHRRRVVGTWLTSPVDPARLIACALAAIGTASQTPAQSPESLFATDSPSGFGLRLLELDGQTGVLVRQVPYVNWVGAETALAFDRTRIIIRGNTNWNADRLIRVHPGDGRAVHLASTALRVIADDFDPVGGVVRGVCQNLQAGGTFCCSFDAVTGALTLGPPITSITGITAMAVDSAGTSFVSTAGGGAKLHTLDMTTGATVFVGDLAVPTTLALDLAFDGAGLLWASLQDIHTGADTGLYRVDPLTFVATRVISTLDPYWGIAFATKTAAANFCVSKLSSLGCTPTLRGDGFASPTATLGFAILADNLNNNRMGMLLYSTYGRASIPFQGALLCVQPPLHRSPVSTTGGNPLPMLDCSGSWSVDYNAMIWSKFPNTTSDPAVLPPLLTPGTSVQCQWWGRDPGFPAPNNSMLSDGLEFVLAP